MFNEKQRFSLRKLSVGLASVCIGLSFVNMTNKEVKADTVSAQTSAIETKTNKNNKADTNADASKEVANSTNSVDANKLNPDKTVLNKQATSNDLLEGTDVKQGTQETSAKPSSIQAQSAVFNKDANIKVNSNLNKNTIKQALETSLLKDTTKPEITNTLSVTKASQAPIAENMLKEDKTEVKENQDWADPAKQGYHKTTAGWTKLKQDKDYNSVANTDISIYSSPVGYTDMHPLPKEQNKSLSYLQMDLGVEFKSTIKKEDISKGKKILLGSIPVLRNDDTRHIDWETISNNDLINVGDTQIGTLSVTDNNDEWTYVLNVTTNDKFRTDLDLTYKKRIAQHLDYWNFGGYYGMRGQNSLKPFTQKIMDTSGNTYTLNINPADYNTQWDTSSENDDYNSVFLDTNYHLIYLSNKFQDEALDWKDATAQRVFKIQSLNKDNPITIHPTDRVVDTNYVNAINLDNKKLHESIRTDVGASVLHKLTDNLSAQQLLNATADHTIGYSNQKDGSVLIAYKVHASDFKLTSDRIKDAVQNTYWWNIVNPSNKQEILNHTLDMYKKHDNAVNNLMTNVYLDWDTSKTVSGVITDVTPNKTHLLSSSQLTQVPDGTQSFNTSIYKAINVHFVDDDNNGKTINSDVFTTSTGIDLTYNIKDANDKTFNSATDIAFPTNLVLNQPTTVHYGVVKDTNPDIVIHVKHKHQDVTMSDPKAETTAEYRVIERMPGQYGGNKTIIDLIEHYHKQATKDLVTGVTTYGKYVITKRSFDKKVGKARSAGDDYFFQIPLDQIVGYTTSSINAPSNEKDAYNYPVLNCFTYTANGVPTITLDIGTSGHDADQNNVFDAVPASRDYYIDYTPNTQTSSYKFVDDDANDKQVGNSVTITGKTDQTVNLSYTAPTNYVLVSNQPTTYSFKNIKQANNTYKTNTVPIIIHLKHKHQDVTMSDPKAETIAEYRVIERRPAQYGGNKIGVDLVVHAHKTADKDLVTGNITYGNYLGKTTTFEVKAGHPKYADQLSYFNSIRPDEINGYRTVIQNNWSSPERDALAPNQSSVFNHILYFYHNSDGTYALDFMDGNPQYDSSNPASSADRAFAALPASRDFYVDYVAEPQSIQVKFVDDDNNGKQLGDTITVNGVTDSDADFTSIVNTYKQDNAKHYLFVNTDPSQLSHKFTAGDKTIITINLKHQHAKSTVYAPATRTIVVHMPDGTTKTYVQTIGFVNNIDEDLVTNNTTNIYTVDASKSNTTVNGTVDSNIQAYRKTGNDDATGTNYKFASFVLPKIPGYTAHIKSVSINPNMRLFSVSFMALPKVAPITSQKVTLEPAKPAPIETQVPVETHDSLSNYALTTNDSLPDTHVFNNIESNDLTWQIDKNLNNNVPYHLTNTIYKLRLPRFSNYELHLVKRGTTRNSISFVYTNKSTQLNYVFNLTIQDNKYYLTVGKIDRVNRKILPIKTYNVISYQDLLDNLLNYFK